MTDLDNERVVRPTLRCLLDDLAQELSPPAARQAVRTVVRDMAADPTYLLPVALVDVSHAVLDKANTIASDENALRERIETITDRYVIKVKTGDRRAALWRDDAGTWWLLAAGRRQDDGPGDFYRRLERLSKDSTPIAPTDDDLRYQRLEVAYQAELRKEQAAQARLLAALLIAAREPGSAHSVEIFGAVVSISVLPDEGCFILDMRWEFAQFDEQDRFPADVLAMVPAHASIDDWESQPPTRGSSSPYSWWTLVSEEWVEHMATSAELDQLLPGTDAASPINPSSDGSEHYSHWARGSVVTLAYATGIEIVGLCGAKVVAHRDYERLPVCASCQRSLELLRQTRSPEDV